MGGWAQLIRGALGQSMADAGVDAGRAIGCPREAAHSRTRPPPQSAAFRRWSRAVRRGLPLGHENGPTGATTGGRLPLPIWGVHDRDPVRAGVRSLGTKSRNGRELRLQATPACLPTLPVRGRDLERPLYVDFVEEPCLAATAICLSDGCQRSKSGFPRLMWRRPASGMALASLWRDNQDGNGASIRMRRSSRVWA